MKTIISMLLLLPLLASAQYKQKFEWRDPPEKGETIALVGITLVALTATGLMHNERTDPNLSRAIGMVGGALIYAGVVIDISSKGNRKSMRYKFKSRSRKRKIRIHF